MKTITLLCFLVLPLLVFSQKSYKGAEIYSNESWKYGKVEIRMMMAKGSGILSTFFTYKNGSEQPNTFWEEIDIEVFGKNNAETFQSNIITNNPREYSEEVHSPGFSMGDSYHTYTLEWTPEYVAWYLDGVEMRKSTGGQVNDLVNSQSFRMNIWAAEWVEWVGAFDVQALPAYQFVNWIKYYEYTPASGANNTDFTLQWTDDFNTFNTTRWSKADWTFDGNLVDFATANVVVKDGFLVLAITEAGKTGFTEAVPADTPITSSSVKIKQESFNVKPNPVESELTIEGLKGENWVLLNALGEKVEEGNSTKADMKALTPGIYYLKIDDKVVKVVKD